MLKTLLSALITNMIVAVWARRVGRPQPTWPLLAAWVAGATVLNFVLITFVAPRVPLAQWLGAAMRYALG
jgi:hypothetical protein